MGGNIILTLPDKTEDFYILLQFHNLAVRNATVQDAALLSSWWNDGKIMAHAGFPNGTGETAGEIAESLKKDTDDDRRLIIELDKRPIGEMSYGRESEDTAGIGIKICDFSEHDKGYGKILLSMLISSLFQDLGYKKVICDTNANNKRAQHVYEELGFKKIRLRGNSWKDQLGKLQSFIDYELYQEDFVNFAK
ncbi:MAG: GNAT family N-acetyltransferase [Blautia sp.]|nr:GNAT family N-acetyltransferase [Blautia sp.]